MPTTTAKPRRNGRPRSLTPTPLGRRLLAWIETTAGTMTAMARRADISDESIRAIVYGGRVPRIQTIRALDKVGLPEHLLVDIVRGA